MKQEREPFLRKKTGVILLHVSWGRYPTRYRFPPKPQDQLDIASCAARTYGTWIETLTPNYILGASSKSPYCLRKERWGLSVFWSTSCPDTLKFAFSSPNVEMAAHFPFPRFFAVYRIRFLKNAAFLTKKTQTNGFLIHTDMGDEHHNTRYAFGSQTSLNRNKTEWIGKSIA